MKPGRPPFFSLLVFGTGVASACVTIREETDPDDSLGGGGASSEPDACPVFDAEVSYVSEQASLDVSAVAGMPDCGAVVAGSYFGAPVAPGMELPSSEGWSGFVARFDGAAGVRWSHSLVPSPVSDDQVLVSEVVSDPEGNVWLTGRSDEEIAWADGETLSGKGPFAIAYDAKGQPRWAERLSLFPVSLSRRSDGTIVAVGLNGAALTLLEIDPDTGAPTEHVLGTNISHALDASADDARTTVALCNLSDAVVGDVVLPHHDATPDGLGNPTCDLAMVTFDREGSVIDARQFDETGFRTESLYLTQSDDGEVAIHAYFWGTIDFGDGPISASSIGAGMRSLVARFDASGAVIHSEALGEGSFVFPVGLARDAAGGTFIAGRVYQGSIDFGEGPIEADEDSYAGFAAERSVEASGWSGARVDGVEGLFSNRYGRPLVVVRNLGEGRDLGVDIRSFLDP